MDLAPAQQSRRSRRSRPFSTTILRGFGLLQRDRSFEHYQDLDLAYELRPSYWIEPREGWGEGGVDLVELPTDDETNDNIVAAWTPKRRRRRRPHRSPMAIASPR